MNNQPTITINQTELPVKEYQGQRVVTMKEIDAVHERPEGTVWGRPPRPVPRQVLILAQAQTQNSDF